MITKLEFDKAQLVIRTNSNTIKESNRKALDSADKTFLYK